MEIWRRWFTRAGSTAQHSSAMKNDTCAIPSSPVSKMKGVLIPQARKIGFIFQEL